MVGQAIPIKLTEQGVEQGVNPIPHLPLAPDDSGNFWKPPHLWTREEIKQLVLDHIGMDVVFARGYQVLIMLWQPPQMTDYGLERTDHSLRNESVETCIGMVLRMGKDAFSDPKRFPSGPIITYGEWGIFRVGQRQIMEVNGKRIAYTNDDRALGPTSDPENVTTGIKLEFDWAGQ